MFKKRSRCWGLVVLLGIALCLNSFGTAYVTPVAGSELEERQKELEAIGKEIEQKQKLVEEAKREQASVTKDINILETDIDKTETEINYLNKKLQLLQKQISVKNQELKQAQNSMDERTEILAERLNSIYINGDVSYLEVLLDSSSFSDFLTNFDLLQKIAEQDVTLLEEIAAERQYIETKKNELESAKQEIEPVKAEQQEKQSYLKERSAEKAQQLSAVEKEKNQLIRALNELEADSKRMEKIIRSLQSPQSNTKVVPGAMIWPVGGRLTSDYGMRVHPILKTKRMHTGIDLAASKGTTVKAAKAGKVIFTGWNGAYGQVVVLDHGGGISTMYAHLSSISVSVGQEVTQGKKVGAVGSTGWSTGPHLHFEVRVNGTPANPHKYL